MAPVPPGRRPVNPSDADLVRRSLEGDEGAFGELMDRYKRGIYTLIVRIVRDAEAANDLAQDTFVRLYSSLSSYNPDYKFSSWIFKIANNLAIDHLRRKRPEVFSLDAQVETGGDRVIPQVSSGGQDPLHRVESIELGERIKAAIDGLPVDYRRVILLRHIEEMTYEEIVEVTGLPVGTVKTLLFRGRRMLRRKLQTMRERGGS
jgi:RNA polymerase sigma-70 factor (ECF subfamily)